MSVPLADVLEKEPENFFDMKKVEAFGNHF